jgi:hypothetical protein
MKYLKTLNFFKLPKFYKIQNNTSSPDNKTNEMDKSSNLNDHSINKHPSAEISFVKLGVNDIKGFGRKFNEEEVKKYLDPFGFLAPNEYKEVKGSKEVKEELKPEVSKESSLNQSSTNSSNQTITKTTGINIEELRKLEEIEKIDDVMTKADEKSKNMPKEYGFKYKGKEPTRYGDWEIKGKCVDF